MQLTPPGGGAEGDNYGISVSLSNNNLAVGASGDSSDRGAVYMYGFSVNGPDSLFIPLVSKLSPAVLEPGSLFGSAVALYEGAEVSTPEFTPPATVVIGAPGHGGGEGAAFVYMAADGRAPDWGAGTMLVASANVTSSFGQSVAAFGDVVAVGGSGDGGGVVCIYRNDGAGNWIFEDALMASDASAGDGFGFSLSLYRDLTSDFEAVLLVVGAPASSAVYLKVYNPDVEAWIENSKLTSDSGSDIQFGYSVSCYEGTVAVGAPEASGSAGSVTVYKPYNNSGAGAGSPRVAWAVQTEVCIAKLFQLCMVYV